MCAIEQATKSQIVVGKQDLVVAVLRFFFLSCPWPGQGSTDGST